MFINITDKKEAENKGSSGKLVHYLEKENRSEKSKDPECWFNGQQQKITPYHVMNSLDRNIAKLGRNDAKFFLINISPSKKEISFLKKKYGEAGSRQQLKAFAIKVMDEYAKNFRRAGINNHHNLLWFAKLENYRYYTHNDPEVKKGIKKRGERKEGEQMHIQVIVSRKDKTNKIKLSPQNTSRGRNEEHSRKMGQFDRVAFKQCGEILFDKLFGFERLLDETMEYANTQKKGSLSQRAKMYENNNINIISDISNSPEDNLIDGKKDLGIPDDNFTKEAFFENISFTIADDVDDEAILGMKRRKKRKARTNTR